MNNTTKLLTLSAASSITALSAMYFGLVRPLEKELTTKVEFTEIAKLYERSVKIEQGAQLYCSNPTNTDTSNALVKGPQSGTTAEIIQRMADPIVRHYADTNIEKFNQILDILEENNVQIITSSRRGLGQNMFFFNDQETGDKTLVLKDPNYSRYDDFVKFVEALADIDFNPSNAVTTFHQRPSTWASKNPEYVMLSGNLGERATLPMKQEDFLYSTAFKDGQFVNTIQKEFFADMPTAPCPADDYKFD